MEPKVSIIIPGYNVEPFLARCLDSVVGQTLRGIEIICVDDGSPDRSIDILNRYAAQDDRIRVISQENRGLGGARNRGFDAATGEFILFVDSDDWTDPFTGEHHDGGLFALLPKAVFRSEQFMGAALLYWMNRLPPAEFAEKLGSMSYLQGIATPESDPDTTNQTEKENTV